MQAILPTYLTFDRLVNYLYLSLRNKAQQREYAENTNLEQLFKNLGLAANLTLIGQDPISFFHFLSRFVEEVDIQQLSEAQGAVRMERFLTDEAKDQFDAECREQAKEGITASSEFVDYLL